MLKVFDLCGSMIFMSGCRFNDDRLMMLYVSWLKQGFYLIDLSCHENFSVIKEIFSHVINVFFNIFVVKSLSP